MLAPKGNRSNAADNTVEASGTGVGTKLPVVEFQAMVSSLALPTPSVGPNGEMKLTVAPVGSGLPQSQNTDDDPCPFRLPPVMVLMPALNGVATENAVKPRLGDVDKIY